MLRWGLGLLVSGLWIAGRVLDSGAALNSYPLGGEAERGLAGFCIGFSLLRSQTDFAQSIHGSSA